MSQSSGSQPGCRKTVSREPSIITFIDLQNYLSIQGCRTNIADQGCHAAKKVENHCRRDTRRSTFSQGMCHRRILLLIWPYIVFCCHSIVQNSRNFIGIPNIAEVLFLILIRDFSMSFKETNFVPSVTIILSQHFVKL